MATLRKETKYMDLSVTHTFVPIAFETLGPLGSKGASFLRELGKRLTRAIEDSRKSAFLFQRLSMAI